MNKYTIKYSLAVATLLVATAFCECDDPGGPGEEIVFEKSSTARAEDAGSEALLTGIEKTVTIEENIRVYVCGAVKDAGVYTLAKDERVIEAVEAAGGFADDAGYEYLNLAAPLTDGQKVYVPTKKEVEEAFAADDGTAAAVVNISSNSPGIIPGGSGGSGETDPDTSGAMNGMVNINTADASTLMTLPGIGRSKADKIIAYREQNGGFSRIEDIMKIGGIKEGLFGKIKDRICVR